MNASHIVTDIPATLRPTLSEPEVSRHKVNAPDLLGLDVSNDGLEAVTAPGELFNDGQGWKLARVTGAGFCDTDCLLINRDAAPGDLRSHIAQCIGELVLSLARIEGDQFPALPAFIPESAQGVEAPGYPIVRVPDDLWAGCWANPDQADVRGDAFGRWLWNQSFVAEGGAV